MKRDEIRKLLEGDGEQTIDERLDAIMRMNGDDVEREKGVAKGYKDQLDAANVRLDEFEQARKAQLSNEEKLEEAMAELAEKSRQVAIKSNRVDAKSILKAAGLSDEAMDAQLATIVVEDGEATKANAQALADLISAQREEVKAATEKAMLDKMGHPKGSSGENEVTPDSFKKMTYSQKLELKQTNPDLFKTLNS